jgi:RimJ/RimL family protein N-acetyltransferase
MIPNELFLETDRVLLRPLTEADSETFHLLAQDEGMWQYFSLNLADKSQLQQWMNAAFHDWQVNTRRPFTIMDKASGRIAGSTSMGNISLHDLRLEIGWSWLAKEFRSTELNRHAKFAMMQYAFEHLQFERVEFKTDVQNARAKKGLENIGGRPEGVLRSHMTMWNNRRRDSIYYSVLKNEWPELKQSIFKDITAYEVY